MKTHVAIILIFASLFYISCNRQTVAPSPSPLPVCVTLPMEKPGLQLSGSAVSATEVYLSWQKKGRTSYTVQKLINTQWVDLPRTPCQCDFYRDTVAVGVYTYRLKAGAAISNTVTINTAVLAPPPAPELPRRVFKIAFDGYYIEYWNMFLQNTTLLGSGLEQWEEDSIINYVREALLPYNVTIVREGLAAQTTVVTESDEWYGGGAGGVSYVGSYMTGKENFIFSRPFAYHWKNIAKAIVHEIGHALGLWHTFDLSLITNWMSNVFGVWQRFEIVMDATMTIVDQPQHIHNTL